jgi:hypothetical protein
MRGIRGVRFRVDYLDFKPTSNLNEVDCATHAIGRVVQCPNEVSFRSLGSAYQYCKAAQKQTCILHGINPPICQPRGWSGILWQFCHQAISSENK